MTINHGQASSTGRTVRVARIQEQKFGDFIVSNMPFVDTGTVEYVLNRSLGVNTSSPDKQLEVNSSTGDCLRLTYNDANGSASNYVDLSVSSGGDLTVSASGGDLNLSGNTVTDGRILNVVTKTDTYDATVSDDVIVCNKSSAMTINLLAASGSGRRYIIKNINTGTVTVDGASSDTIDGETTQSLYQWDAIQIVDYAANSWVVI